MTEENNQLRALILSVLMVVSVFGGTIALAGTAAAAASSIDNVNVEDAPTNTDNVQHEVSFDVTVDGDTSDNITLNYSAYTTGTISAVDSTSASSNNSSAVTVDNATVDDDNVVIEVTEQTGSSQTVTITATTQVDVANATATDETFNVTAAGGTPSDSDTFSVVEPSAPDDSDKDITENVRLWSGQTGYTAIFDSNDDGVELFSVASDGSTTFESQITVNEVGGVLLDTSGLETGDYYLNDTNDDGESVKFSISEQDYSSSVSEGTVKNAGATNTDITVTSNRNGYTHLLTSPEVDGATIQSILGGVGTQFDTNDDGTNDGLLIDGTTSDTLPANFTGVAAGDYTINFMVTDTGVTTSETITVQDAAEGSVAFNQSVYSEEQGDVASIVIDMENGAETSTITIGSEDVNYVANVTVMDGNGDGQVTLLWNTATAASGDNPFQAAAAADGDSVDDFNLNTPELDGRLGATEYELSAEFNGEEAAVGVVSLTSPSNVERNAQTWTAAGSIAQDDLEIPGDVSQDSEIATGDYVVLQFETAGIYGTVTEASDLNASSPTDSVSVSINETADSTGINADPKSQIAEDFELITDAENNQFFLVANEDDLANVAQGDEFEATLTIGEGNPYVSDNTTVSTTFSIEAQSATVDAESLEVESSENATITGTSSLSQGSELTVRLRNSGGDNPFLRQQTVTVGENGDYSAQIDLSDIPAGTNFTVNVLAGGNSLLANGALDATVVESATANLQLASLDAPTTASPGETITVTATVENMGGASGTEDVSFVFEGETVETQSVTVDAGSSQDVTFEATVPSDAGDYTHGVQVGDNDLVTAGITVEADDTTTETTTETTTKETTTEETTEETTTEETTTEETEETATETATEEEGGQPGFGIAVALVALVAAALLAVRRDN